MIQDMVDFHVQVMSVERVNGAKTGVGPSVTQVIAADGAVSERAGRVIHVAHHQDVARRLVKHLTHGPGLPRMGPESHIQFFGHRLDALLAPRRRVHGLYHLAVVSRKPQ